ncbi:hypothetical protein AB3G45_15425 [Shinella sp. S4-D37]|uniref:hypothetical protein n=1 Tax=Shinella sp. S4-D37 TaxID=3161999 RepID=UPI0034677E84
MTIHLTAGRHALPAEGLCAMELTALLAGETHSDNPRCASPMLAAYVRRLNDNMPDDERQRLALVAPRLIGTAGSEAEEVERAVSLAWHAIRVLAPAALRASSRSKRRAATARALERQTDLFKAWTKCESVRDRLARQEGGEWSPAVFAVHRALEAARGAAYLSIGCRGVLSEVENHAAVAAAGAAIYTHLAGCGQAWALALDALNEALEIGAR